MAFPVVRKQNAAEVGMAVKTNTKQIENLAFQPVRAGPDGNERIDRRIAATHANAQANSVAAGDGHQLIVQLEARLDREAIQASGIREEIELELGVCAAAFGGSAQVFTRYHNRGIAPIFDHFCNRSRVPGTEGFGYKISILTGGLRHDFDSVSAGYLCQSSAPFFQR